MLTKARLKRMLMSCNVVQHGEFVLKSGATSDTYVDLKRLPSYPNAMAAVATGLARMLPHESAFSLVGVPHGAVPIATAVSMLTGIPQLTLRKTTKEYGTKRRIEGACDALSRNVVVLEDVVTTGNSALEQCQVLQAEGYTVLAVLAVVCRHSVPEDSALGRNFPFKYLLHSSEITQQHLPPTYTLRLPPSRFQQTFVEANANTVIWAYDSPDTERLFRNLDSVLPHIAGLKLHSEILHLSDVQRDELIRMCHKHNVFIWEDRKYNDTGNTVALQYARRQPYDVVSVVPTSGPDILEYLAGETPCFVLCEMSSRDSAFNPLTAEHIRSMVLTSPQLVDGVICQSASAIEEAAWLGVPSIVPGVRLQKGGPQEDERGQRWRTLDAMPVRPRYIVVGRGLTNAPDPAALLVSAKQQGLC